MSSSHPSLSRPTGPSAVLDRLPPVGAAHPDVRRYSRARRNVLARDELVTAVTSIWALEQVLRSGVVVETALWCPAEPTCARRGDETTWAAVAERAGRAHLISMRTLSRIHPGLAAPAMVAVVRLPRWRPVDVLSERAQLILVADGVE
jgi:hypothetical protein